MKEPIAMWKQCLVHFDLFIICSGSKAARRRSRRCEGVADAGGRATLTQRHRSRTCGDPPGWGGGGGWGVGVGAASVESL